MITQVNEETLNNLMLEVYEAGNTAKALSLVLKNAYELSIDSAFTMKLDILNQESIDKVIDYKDNTETMFEYMSNSLTSLKDKLYKISDDIEDIEVTKASN